MLKLTTVICAGVFFGLVMFASSSTDELLGKINKLRKRVDGYIEAIDRDLINKRLLSDSEPFKTWSEQLQQRTANASEPAGTEYRRMWPDPKNITIKEAECMNIVRDFENGLKHLADKRMMILEDLGKKSIIELEKSRSEIDGERKKLDDLERMALKSEASSDVEKTLYEIRSNFTNMAIDVSDANEKYIDKLYLSIKEDGEKIIAEGKVMNDGFLKCTIEAAISANELHE